MARPFELPELLAEIAEVAGLSAALTIARFRGGTRVHFPHHTADDHWLPVLVGRKAANQLSEHFRVGHRGGVSVQVPMGPTKLYDAARLQVIALRKQGASISETARRVGVSSRFVEKCTARARAEAKSDARRRLTGGGVVRDPAPQLEASPLRLAPRPDILAEIAEIAGMPVSLAVAESCAHRSASFALPMPDEHWLVTEVGRETADRLGRHFADHGGQDVAFSVPVPTSFLRSVVHRRALALVEEGRSAAEVAAEMSVTPDRVTKWCAAARAARRKEAARATGEGEG